MRGPMLWRVIPSAKLGVQNAAESKRTRLRCRRYERRFSCMCGPAVPALVRSPYARLASPCSWGADFTNPARDRITILLHRATAISIAHWLKHKMFTIDHLVLSERTIDHLNATPKQACISENNWRRFDPCYAKESGLGNLLVTL